MHERMSCSLNAFFSSTTLIYINKVVKHAISKVIFSFETQTYPKCNEFYESSFSGPIERRYGGCDTPHFLESGRDKLK